jgi:hypothetical protein
MVDAGYFAKRIMRRPDYIEPIHIVEICSATLCMSEAPEGWIEHWRHNDLGWFNTIQDAWFVVPEHERPSYRLFAFRIAETGFRDGGEIALQVPENVRPDPITSDFAALGFDAVSSSNEGVLGFECSPLSCNSMANEMTVNELCLLDTEAAAASAAASFSVGDVEPGDYFVVEVLELRSC